MADIEVMQRAKLYLDQLVEGIDPVTGQPVPADDVVRNLRLSRCLSYVSDVLQQVIDNGGQVQADRPPRL